MSTETELDPPALAEATIRDLVDEPKRELVLECHYCGYDLDSDLACPFCGATALTRPEPPR